MSSRGQGRQIMEEATLTLGSIRRLVSQLLSHMRLFQRLEMRHSLVIGEEGRFSLHLFNTSWPLDFSGKTVLQSFHYEIQSYAPISPPLVQHAKERDRNVVITTQIYYKFWVYNVYMSGFKHSRNLFETRCCINTKHCLYYCGIGQLYVGLFFVCSSNINAWCSLGYVLCWGMLKLLLQGLRFNHCTFS